MKHCYHQYHFITNTTTTTTTIQTPTTFITTTTTNPPLPPPLPPPTPHRHNQNNFHFFHYKNYQFMPKIIVVEHRDHFYWIPQVIFDRNTLFPLKKKRNLGVIFFIMSIVPLFFTFLTTTTTPLQIIQFCRKQILT